MGGSAMGRIEELEAGIKDLHEELRECREQHALAVTDRVELRVAVASLQATVAALQTAQAVQAAQIGELTAANAALLRRLLDGPTGPDARAAREDARAAREETRFKLLVDKIGPSVAKAIASAAALGTTLAGGWWLLHFGSALPTPTATPTAIVAPEVP